MSCLSDHSRSGGAHGAPEVFRGDDVGRVDAPRLRELDPTLLEVDRAVTPVRHHHVAALPRHLVVRVDTLGRPHPLDLEPGRPHGPCPTLASGDVARHVSCPLVYERIQKLYLVRVSALTAAAAAPSSRAAAAARSVSISRSKSLERLERAVDAREAQVGHLVEVAQWAEDREPDIVAGDLGGALGPNGLFHLLGQQRDGVLVDRPPLAGLAHASDDLRAAERLGDAAALDHGEDGLLDGGEPLAALGARTAPPDQLAVVGLARVDDPRVGVSAVRTAHRRPSSPELIPRVTLVRPSDTFGGAGPPLPQLIPRTPVDNGKPPPVDTAVHNLWERCG